MTEKKLFIARGDSLPAIVAKALTERSAKIILVIPSGADIGVSMQNFQLLRREVEQAGKELAIESIDEHLLELASLAGIAASNSFFKSRERAVSDIVARPVRRAGEPSRDRSAAWPVRPIMESVKSATAGRRTEEMPPEAAIEISKPLVNHRESVLEPKEVEPDEQVGQEPEDIRKAPLRRPRTSRRSFSTIVKLIAVAAFVAAGWWVAMSVLPRATVTVRAARISAPVSEQVQTSVKIAVPDDSGVRIILPAQAFDARKNQELTFPTEGRATVSARASGTLVVTNAFSSESQILVATTRFVSPSGKVFRLNQRSIISGARVSNGVIQPSTTTVAVTANEPGESYNVAVGDGWRIPGFEGTPKYDKFTAAAPEAFRGGFVGERAIPAAAEISAAEASVDASLKDALEGEFALIASDRRFVALPEATKFTVVRHLVSPGADPTSFRVFGEATLRRIVFDEEMLREAIGVRAVRSMTSSSRPLAVDSVDVSFGEPSVDFEAGTLNVSATGTAALRYVLDPQELTSLILGKDETNLRFALSDIDGVSQATVRLWPFWVHRTPSDPEKITVVLE